MADGAVRTHGRTCRSAGTAALGRGAPTTDVDARSDDAGPRDDTSGGAAARTREVARADRRALLGGGLFGLGLGAAVDVALFHHVLQWHHLLSARIDPTTVAGLRRNLVADGAFTLVTLAALTAGAAVAWRAANRSPAPLSSVRLLGAVLVGVGAFNLFDGVVDHYLLDLHDVVQHTGALNPHWVGASLLLLGAGLLVLGRSG